MSFVDLEHFPFMTLELAHVVVIIHTGISWPPGDGCGDGVMGLPRLMFVNAATNQGLYIGR